MEVRKLLEILHTAERLKDTLRHCDTSGGRHESVAEHCWRTALMAYFLRDEFPDIDMDKVVRMCLVHDLGECFTGDIPVFLKTQDHESREASLLDKWLAALPQPYAGELHALFEEMTARETPEAKVFKALDGLEALIQHNEADLETWLPNEYELQMTYADDRVAFSPYLQELRKAVRSDSAEKIKNK